MGSIKETPPHFQPIDKIVPSLFAPDPFPGFLLLNVGFTRSGLKITGKEFDFTANYDLMER